MFAPCSEQGVGIGMQGVLVGFAQTAIGLRNWQTVFVRLPLACEFG